jgi:transposase-like protein
LGLEPGNAESTDAWASFFRGLKARGLRDPLLVVSDGGAGLIGAIELVFSDSLRQRCLVHRARNLLAKVPAHAQATLKAEFWQVFDGIDAEPGKAAVAEATRRARRFAAKWRKLYPSAVACLEDDFCHLVTYLRFPVEHQGRICHSNFIERTFGETRRRVKVIGRLPGERTCLSLVWAVLDRASRGWRGVQQTLGSIRLLAELRRELFDQAPTDKEVTAETAVTSAA